MKLILIIFFIIIILLYFNKNIETIDHSFDNYKSFYQKNYDKVSLPKSTKIFFDNCLEICNDNTFCNNFNKMKLNYEKCVICQKKGHCYKKFDTNQTVCEPCIKGVTYINKCESVKNYACPNPKDIYNKKGIKPYFNVIKDNNLYNPYNTKCEKCNNNV